MTSKTSFFNSLREDMRHRVWVPALACVVFLLSLIFSTLTIQSLSFENANGIDSYETARLLSQIKQMYDRQNFLLTIVAITGAVICGFQGFAYLSSKCQLDFYHSLPLRREKFFLIRWINGVLFYVVPALAFSILSSIVLTAFGFMSTGVLGSLIIGFLHNLLIFLLVYHSAILACMITGNTLVAIGVLGMFVLYPLMITQLVPSFMSVYYHTYANYSIGLAEYLNYLSPFWIIFQLYRVSTVASYLFTIVYTTALLALSIVLYRMRASESAQKAIAFPKLRIVLRVMLVIPIALYAGLFFGQLAPGFSSFWSILGLVVFLVLVHAILEVIFDFDIHSAFHHKKEMIVCGVFSIAFMTVFLTDVLKLDQQIPSQHSVKAVYMDLPIDNDVDYRDLKTGNYISVTAYREEHAVLTGDDLDKAYALLDCRIGYANSAAEEIEYDATPVEEAELYDVTSGDADYITESDLYDASSSDTDYDHILNLNVRFVKNNGQNEYRNFQIVLEDSEDGGDHFGVLCDILVNPDIRGRGIGSALLDAALGWFASRGLKDVYLESGKDNHPAHEFFMSKGFFKVSEVYARIGQ